MTKKTTITQPKKSKVALDKERSHLGRFVKKGDSVYCVSFNPHSDISKNASKYFEFMIKLSRERKRL